MQVPVIQDLQESLRRHRALKCGGSPVCMNSLLKNFGWLCQPLERYFHAGGNPMIFENTEQRSPTAQR